jgi:hydroxymethylpyrimidine/phosphomethylpyrimidine kinase
MENFAPKSGTKADSMSSTARILIIAGSDSGGGAGIQADIKTVTMLGGHAMTAVTAVTAQNTLGVTAIHPVPAEVILAQIEAVVGDIGVDAVKIGMLGSVATMEAVGEALDLIGDVPVVLDPVMISESGARLLDEDAQEALRTQLVPRAMVVTPNVPEAHVLSGDDELEAEQLVRAVHALGPRIVVLTGGHREEATDIFFDGERLVEIPGERYDDGAAHGSGCTHSSALAAHLALGLDPLDAAREAKRIASEAVRDGLRSIGEGAGPVDVFGLGSA